MVNLSRHKVALAILSGVLLGCAYPPLPSGMLAAVAFVPLFILFECIEDYGKGLRYGYLMLVVFNAITLYWIGGFTHGRDIYLMLAGGILLLAHPMFFFPVIVAWIFFRRHFGFHRSLLAFPFFWVAFEYFRCFTQFSFPWISIGNTQTYDLSMIQMTSFTGVFGLSFLLLWINVIIYFVFTRTISRQWKPFSVKTIFAAASIIVMYTLPKLYGHNVLQEGTTPSGKVIRVGIIQPNIDPFEKWQGAMNQQLPTLQSLTKTIPRLRTDLVLWPETAVPYFLLHPTNRMYLDQIKRQVDSLGIPLLTGIPDIEYYQDAHTAPRSSKVSSNGQRYDTFNSSLLIQPHSDKIQKYAKMVLVPFGERVPYSDELSFLNAMQWNFGLGGWAVGNDTTVFHFNTSSGVSANFSNMICYESIYPGFVAGFVRKGAEFLTVITNDSWWGNTSGAYQHKQIAVLRAVENRRWVVQCANGGISFVIDPLGNIIQEQSMYTQAVFTAEIEPRTEMTFYSRHGDWLAEGCTIFTLFLLVATLGAKFYASIRKSQCTDTF